MKKPHHIIHTLRTLQSAYPACTIYFRVPGITGAYELEQYEKLPRALRTTGYFTVNRRVIELDGDIEANFLSAILDGLFAQ